MASKQTPLQAPLVCHLISRGVDTKRLTSTTPKGDNMRHVNSILSLKWKEGQTTSGLTGPRGLYDDHLVLFLVHRLSCCHWNNLLEGPTRGCSVYIFTFGESVLSVVSCSTKRVDMTYSVLNGPLWELGRQGLSDIKQRNKYRYAEFQVNVNERFDVSIFK